MEEPKDTAFIQPKQDDLGRAQQELEPGPKVEQETQPEREPDAGLNLQIPVAIARIAWPHDTVAGNKYVESTAPILDLIEFHKCLGPMGDLPPMVRLIIGSAVIIGGVVVIKVGQRKKEPHAKAKATPEERRAKGEDHLLGSPEGKANDARPVRKEPDAAGGADGRATRPFYRPFARGEK